MWRLVNCAGTSKLSWSASFESMFCSLDGLGGWINTNGPAVKFALPLCEHSLYSRRLNSADFLQADRLVWEGALQEEEAKCYFYYQRFIFVRPPSFCDPSPRCLTGHNWGNTAQRTVHSQSSFQWRIWNTTLLYLRTIPFSQRLCLQGHAQRRGRFSGWSASLINCWCGNLKKKR